MIVRRDKNWNRYLVDGFLVCQILRHPLGFLIVCFLYFNPILLYERTNKNCIFKHDKENKYKCTFCSESHSIRQCASFYTSVFFASNVDSKVESVLPNNYTIMSFTKLKRIIAYCFRFAYKKIANQSDELQKAEKAITYIFFSTWIVSKWNKTFKKGDESYKHPSQLKQLCPFLDENNLLRVGRRLKNATDLSYNSKHQSLLLHKHFATKLS